jgi:hypothetical protein
MWNDDAGKWLTQPAGIAAFHAGTIGSDQHGRHNDKALAVRLYVESLLSALPPGPVVLFVDAQGFRTIYPGLQNHHFGAGTLPAVNLSTQRDVAIVRCNTSDEVPRPVNRQGGNRAADPRQPAAPDGYVYQLQGHDTWLFPKKSRLYKAKGRSALSSLSLPGSAPTPSCGTIAPSHRCPYTSPAAPISPTPTTDQQRTRNRARRHAANGRVAANSHIRRARHTGARDRLREGP